MKDILGFLHVAGLFVFYALVVIILIGLIITFYLMLGVAFLLAMIISYHLLGVPWFYIVWGPIITWIIIHNTRKWWDDKSKATK